jgi:hypothetical protein
LFYFHREFKKDEMKNLILIICMLLFVGSSFCKVSTYQIKTEKTEVNDTENWILIKTENGINVYYATYKETMDVSGLKIKFENTLDEDVKIYWSLRKGDVYFLKNGELLIGSKKTHQIGNTTMIAPLAKEDLLTDYIIIFHKNQ